VPEGIKANFYVTGGEVTGPKIRGKLRPAGGDWLTVRRDGVVIMDVRVTVETHDGALILVTYPGIIDLGEDGYDKFLRGELPPILQIRIAPRFFTSHPNYLWLNRNTVQLRRQNAGTDSQFPKAGNWCQSRFCLTEQCWA